MIISLIDFNFVVVLPILACHQEKSVSLIICDSIEHFSVVKSFLVLLESPSIILLDNPPRLVVDFQNSIGHVDIHPQISINKLQFIEVGDCSSSLINDCLVFHNCEGGLIFLT